MAPYGKAVEDGDPSVQEQRNLDKLQTTNQSKDWLTNRELVDMAKCTRENILYRSS